jgi:hypothetical protein
MELGLKSGNKRRKGRISRNRGSRRREGEKVGRTQRNGQGGYKERGGEN